MRVIRNHYCGETQYILSTVEVSRGFSTSRVPTWRNLSLPAPRRHNSGSTVIPACRCQNAQLFVHSPAFGGKKIYHRSPSSPKSPQKTPSSDTSRPDDTSALALTLPPSVPCYPTLRIPTPPSRPATAVPMPTSAQHRELSLPQTRPPDRQYHSNRRQNPSLDPHSAPRPARCPTGISGNERK